MYQQVVSCDCEFVEAKCQDSGDLKRHWTTYHCPETALEEFERGQIQCKKYYLMDLFIKL